MKVLVIGSGGREHAIVRTLAEEGCEVLSAPGNPGIARLARCLPLAVSDIPDIVSTSAREAVDLVVVGPEAPLAAGLADALMAAGIPCFGPDAEGARIESSKWFAKKVMMAAGVATAEGEFFTSPERVLDYTGPSVDQFVFKADGLAAGKGVFLPRDEAEAEAAMQEIFSPGIGSPGVVVERRLLGREASVMAICSGTRAVVLPPGRDHKRAFDGDAGPNTGGMGAVSPPQDLGRDFPEQVCREVIEPVLSELARRGVDYRGVLYAGMMITADGPFVLEFNCRFGDPETQAILPRLSGGLSDALLAAARGLDLPGSFGISAGAGACVVLASGGYPGGFNRGYPIDGLDEVEDAVVFHAGTAVRAGRVVTDGGRVLGITGLGDDLPEALRKAYAAASVIRFQDCYYRKDIGRIR